MVFGEITGVLNSEQEGTKTAIVNYILKYNNITPFGEIDNLHNKNQGHEEKYTTDRIIEKQATFLKYDDGWQIQE